MTHAQVKYIPGSGNPTANLVVVAEAPGKWENIQGEVLVGPSGRLTDQMLEKAGTHRSEVYCTNVEKYRPPDNKINRLPEIGIKPGQDIPQLWREIEAINPNCILALGNHSLRALTGLSGITNYRGSILRASHQNRWKVVSTYHPANLLPRRGDDKGYKLKYSAHVYIQRDFRRAVEESAFPRYDVPNPYIVKARTAKDVRDYIRAYFPRLTKCAVDIETIKCVPATIALCFDKKHAIAIPIINIPDADRVLPETELVNMWAEVAKLLEDPRCEVIGQNFKFDHQKLLRPCGIKVANVFADTMIMMHTLYPELPRNLAFMTSVFTRIPFYKSDLEEFHFTHELDTLLHYNGLDVVTDLEIWEKLDADLEKAGLKDFYYNFAHHGHHAYMDLENEGFRVDTDKREELIVSYAERGIAAMTELEELVGYPVNCNSPKQVSQLLYEDIGFPKRTGTGEEVLYALAANHARTPKKKQVIDLVLKIRKLRRTLTVLKARPDYDGRMRCSYKITGTEPGRTSTAVLKAPVRPDEMGFPFQTITKHGEIGADIGEILIADPECVIVGVDAKQIQARFVALLSRDYDFLARMDKIDIHIETASDCFGIPYDKIPKKINGKENPKRFVGKTTRHAGNFDMQKRRLAEIVNTDGRKYNIDVDLSEYRAGKILDIFHRKSPNIRGVFHAEVRAAIQSTRTLVCPSGRRRQFLDRMEPALFREAFSYIPQGAETDHIKSVMFEARKRKPNIRFCLEAHDGLYVHCPEREVDETVALLKELMERPISFERCTLQRGEIVIPAEFSVGYNYKDMEELAA